MISPHPISTVKSGLKTFLVLILLLLPALLIGSGERPVSKIQEVRVAETAREMLASGDWLVPRYNGELRLQKPPLPYWLTAVSYSVGGVNEMATRIPSVLFGLLGALLLWSWLRRELGESVAAATVLVFVASYIGLRYFRSGEADAILLFWIAAACRLGYGLLRGEGGWRRQALFGLALGLGFLSKGPAGLAIPALSLVVMAVIEKRAGRPLAQISHLFSLAGISLLVVSAFGWYLWILWQLPEAAALFFGHQVDETFITGNHAQPAWWYLAHWAEYFAPWGILILPALWMAWRQRAQLPPVVRFAWIWLAVVFVLLSWTVNKQMQYALLFAPPLSIVLGHYLADAKGGFARLNKVLFWLFCILVLIGVGVMASKEPQSLLLLVLVVVPLFAKRIIGETDVPTPLFFVGAVTVAVFLISETHFSKKNSRVATQSIVEKASGCQLLFQTLNNGGLSFYSRRVVPRVKDSGIEQLLSQHDEFCIIAEDFQPLPGRQVTILAESDGMRLYRIGKEKKEGDLGQEPRRLRDTQ